MAANAASFPIEETSIAELHAAYLDGWATALSVCQAISTGSQRMTGKARPWERSSSTTPTRGRTRPRWMPPWHRLAS
jgi:hypothetical protein